MTTTLSSDPEYRAFVAAMEATPEDRTARAAFADWLDERGLPAEAAAFRASAEDATEYARMVPTPIEWTYHVRRYHTPESDSYTFVGIWPTLLEAVSAFVRWHLRGEFETKCSECDNGSVDTGGFTPWDQPISQACNYCKGSGWVPICGHRNCDHPGEACGEIVETEDGEGERQPREYYCSEHAATAGYCRSCRCPIGMEMFGELCGECEWESRHDNDDDNDLTDDPDYWLEEEHEADL